MTSEALAVNPIVDRTSNMTFSPFQCRYTYTLNFSALRSPGARCRRQSRVLRFLPEREGAARRLFAGGCDRDFADATVLAFMDLNEPVANETTEVAGQRGPLKTLKFREARGRNRAGLNQRRQQGELRASNARPSHCLLEGAGPISAPTARSGAHALPAGDEVDFFTLHITCVYTFSRAVKAQSRRSIKPRCLSLVGPIEP